MSINEDTIGELQSAKKEFQQTKKAGPYFVKIHEICLASQSNKMFAKQFYNDEIRFFMRQSPEVVDKFKACAQKYGFPLEFNPE